MISSLSEAAATYRIVAQAEGKSPRTIEWVEGSARYLREFLGDDPPPQELTRHDLRRFIAALRERPKWAEHPFNRPKGRISPTSINNYVRGIKLLFSALEREGLLPPHEITTMKAPKIPKKVIVPFTESQIRDVFKALQNGRAPLRDRAMTWLMLDPGLRVSELIFLKDEDVDLNERQVRVMGKGEKERVLPLGAWVTKALLTYKVKARPEAVGTEAFFLSRDASPMTRHSVEQMLRRTGAKAGVKQVHPHRFRHTFAIFYLRNGGDSFHLQRLLGHSSLEMTRRYALLADSDVRAAHRKFSPGDRLRF